MGSEGFGNNEGEEGEGENWFRSFRVLDVINHLQTIISVAYATSFRASSVKKVEITKEKSPIKENKKTIIMREERIWERWDAKKRKNAEAEASRKISAEEEKHNKDIWISNSSRNGRPFGFTYGDISTASSNTMRNRNGNMQNMNVVSYNNMYNGVMMAQRTPTTIHNEFDQKKLHEVIEKPGICNTFHDYCAHCTIHGLKYVGDTNLPSFDRSFWIFSFMLAIVGAAYFIWHLYSKFTLSPIIISRSSESVSIDQFPFPALTICNMNNAKKSVAETIKHGNDELQKLFLDDICNTNTDTKFINEASNRSGDWDNMLQFLVNISPDCTSMLYHCLWHGNSTNCTEIFNPILTDEGLCCKFNTVPRILYDPKTWGSSDLETSYLDKHIDWTPEYKFKKTDSINAIPWRALGSGASYGLTLALDVNVDEYFCSSTASVGFKMLLHSPVETPQIADFGFTLSPGKETRVIITPHITEADASIKKISPKIRRCYFLGEKKLKYYRTYTARNCLSECEADFVLNFCKCIPYYMPVNNNSRICGKTDDSCAFAARSFMKTRLYDEDDPKVNTTNYNFTLPSCKCYPGCYEINYSTEISQSMLIAAFDIPDEYLKNDAEYYEKNMAIVHIFFIDSSYMKYTKNELYGFAELLSNTGGLLGLFMGFSLLSVIEIFYYFLLRIWWRIHKYRNMKNGGNKFQVVHVLSRGHDNVYPFAQ